MNNRILSVYELTELISKSTTRTQKFEFHEVAAEDILDFKDWCKKCYKNYVFFMKLKGVT